MSYPPIMPTWHKSGKFQREHLRWRSHLFFRFLSIRLIDLTVVRPLHLNEGMVSSFPALHIPARSASFLAAEARRVQPRVSLLLASTSMWIEPPLSRTEFHSATMPAGIVCCLGGS